MVLKSNPIAAFPTISRAVREAKFIISNVISLDPEPLISVLILLQSLNDISGHGGLVQMQCRRAYMFRYIIESRHEAAYFTRTKDWVQRFPLSLVVCQRVSESSL